MIKKCSNFQIVLIISSLAGLLFTGCASMKIVVPETTVNYHNQNKYKLNIKVEITKSIMEAKFDLMKQGDEYLLGSNLRNNIEALSKSIFDNVIISSDQGIGSSDMKIDAILIPELLRSEGSIGMLATDDAVTTIILKWTLTNLKGDILWIDSVKGEGRSITGYGLGGKNYIIMSNIRIEESIKDLFSKSYDSIYSSPAIKKLSGSMLK